MGDLLALLGAPRPRTFARQGVLMQLNFPGQILRGTVQEQLYKEAVASARLLREGPLASRQWPVAIVATLMTWEFIQRQPDSQSLWDAHVPFNITRSRENFEAQLVRHPDAVRMSASNSHWLWKTATFLLTPFEETLYIDTDVLVLSPHFVSDLLDRSLRIADLVAPVDPNRPGRQVKLSRTGKFHINPPVFGRGIPPLCMGIAAYRLTASVRALWERSAARLMSVSTPSDPSDPRILIRQSDQEMIWAELMYGPVDRALRVFALPEEYYCPMVPLRRVIHRGHAGVPTWATSYHRGERMREYPCHALHGHYSEAKLSLANLSRLLPRSISFPSATNAP